MIKPDHPEVGRSLLVSDLKPRDVVWVQKDGNNTVVTLRVIYVEQDWVLFGAPDLKRILCVQRCGPDNELLRDGSGAPIQTYEYLGKI